jgi:hypothetical protein
VGMVSTGHNLPMPRPRVQLSKDKRTSNAQRCNIGAQAGTRAGARTIEQAPHHPCPPPAPTAEGNFSRCVQNKNPPHGNCQRPI